MKYKDYVENLPNDIVKKMNEAYLKNLKVQVNKHAPQKTYILDEKEKIYKIMCVAYSLDKYLPNKFTQFKNHLNLIILKCSENSGINSPTPFKISNLKEFTFYSIELINLLIQTDFLQNQNVILDILQELKKVLV